MGSAATVQLLNWESGQRADFGRLIKTGKKVSL